MAGAWLMNMLPFIGITRVMFLYHYFTALVWAILMLAYVVDRSRHVRRTVLGISAALVLRHDRRMYNPTPTQIALSATLNAGQWCSPR